MNRASSFLGRMVISLASGRVIGKLRKLVCDLDEGRLGGLLVQPIGARGSPVALPFEEIESIGVDAIMVRTSTEAIGLQSQARVMTMLERENRIYTTGIYTPRGRKIGYLVEPYFAPDQDMRLVAFELFSDAVFTDRVRGILLHGEHIQVGQDLILVPEDLNPFLLEEDVDPEEDEVATWVSSPPRRPGQAENSRPAVAEVRARALVQQLASVFSGIEEETSSSPEPSKPVTSSEPYPSTDSSPSLQDLPTSEHEDIVSLPEAHPPEPPLLAASSEGDSRLIRFVLGKVSSRDLRTPDGRAIIHRGEVIQERTVQLARDHEMLTLLFLAASQTSGRSG